MYVHMHETTVVVVFMHESWSLLIKKKKKKVSYDDHEARDSNSMQHWLIKKLVSYRDSSTNEKAC